MKYLLFILVLCYLLLGCAAQSAKVKREPKREKYAVKVMEEEWSGTTPQPYHWECPKGTHVYWWEVNIIMPDSGPMVPMCIEPGIAPRAEGTQLQLSVPTGPRVVPAKRHCIRLVP